MFILFGILIGFAAAVPVGPVNVFIASQTLKRDFLHGFLAALTTAVLDFIYCAVALIGLFQIKVALKPGLISIMKIVAGLIIIGIGYKLARDSKTFSVSGGGTNVRAAAAKPILGVLALYVSNPSLYVFWMFMAGWVTSNHIVGTSGWKAFAFAAACGLGALIWYSTLVRWLSTKQHKIRQDTFRRILYILGFILIIIGLYTMSSTFIQLPKVF